MLLALLYCAASTISITDGDTIHACGQRVRLAAIDTPEMPGHCRRGRVCTPGDPYQSRDALKRLIGNNPVTLLILDRDRYGRAVACVFVGGIGVNRAMVEGGFAVPRYRPLSDCDRVGR